MTISIDIKAMTTFEDCWQLNKSSSGCVHSIVNNRHSQNQMTKIKADKIKQCALI